MLKIILTKTSEKDFSKLPKVEQKKVYKKLKSLSLHPLSGKQLKGELKSLYSIRAWPYRILYELDREKNTICIHRIQHRQGVYK